MMRIRGLSIDRKTVRENFSNIFGLVLVFVSVFTLGFEVYAGNRGEYGGAGRGGTSYEACAGNCLTIRTSGAYWVTFESPSDTFYITDIDSSFLIMYNKDDIMTCKAGAPVYVLVNQLSQKNGHAGPINMNVVFQKDQYIHDAPTEGLPSNATPVDEKSARDRFNYLKGKAEEGKISDPSIVDQFDDFTYTSNRSGTGGLGWFCGDPGITTTTTTTTTTTPEAAFSCPDSYERERGRTTTRIAVKNKSLGDGWNAGGQRSGLTTDSGWTDDDAEVFTIAKPGDSIQFLHAVCMQDRYARRTSTQSSWTSEESYDTTYNIPAQSFTIGAKLDGNPDSFYAFGNGIEVVNGQSRNVTVYDGWYTTSGQAGVQVDSDRYGIQTLSPTPDNNDYNCDAIAQYANRDPYIKNASFQIPGFDSGSCDSAQGSRRKNLVGDDKIVEQHHEFDSIKVWEQYSSDVSGSCGCDDNTATLDGNYTASEYEDAWDGSYKGHHKEYKCETDGDCCLEEDEDGDCISSATDYKLTDDSSKFMYHTTHSNEKKTKTAEVYVPYNFLTTVSSSIDANDVVFQGSSVTSDFEWKIKKRSNPTTSSFSYATVTPSDTEVQMIEFILEPNATEQEIEGKKDSEEDPCDYYGGIDCRVIKTKTGNQNPRGLYKGKSNSASYTRLVPDDDEYVGYKYCVAVGIYPADSHDYQGNELWQQYSTGTGGAMDAGELWNISGASCRTIAKKPNFQVWNGSVYTQGEVNTSISQKMAGESGAGAERGNNYDWQQTTLFGSWVDYAIVTNENSINGLSSGAMLGYNNIRYDLSGGGGANASTYSNYSSLSPMTVSNTGGNSSIGRGKVNASSSISVNLERLYSRYKLKALTYANESGYGSQARINTHSTGMQYVYYNGNTSISNLGFINAGSNPNQTTTNSSALVKGYGDGVNDNTLVIYVKGKLTIDRNICLVTGCGGDPTMLSTYGSDSTRTNASAKLPQILIFADNIDITEGVNRIDAWLIVENGKIDTCQGYSIGNNLAAADAKRTPAYSSYGNCYKTLVVNGPVYAKEISLKRTAGNNHGFSPSGSSSVRNRSIGNIDDESDANKGSAAPAEIFNLRADAYIWAYNQAERYSEAVVTYTRELAPRY